VKIFPRHLLVLAGLLVLAFGPYPLFAQEFDLRDEAARACPIGVDPADFPATPWCGIEPGEVIARVDGRSELTVFREHPHANIAALPMGESADLDWTCIEGACGGLLDATFIEGRVLSHLWPTEPGGAKLRMTKDRLSRAIKGRNSWLLWTGGNSAFWDFLARHGYGLADFLKLLDNRYIEREDRFRMLGVINEPGMYAPDRPGRFGIKLDIPVGWSGEWPPPLGTQLPEEVPDPYVYGYSSGVLGMRLFPNPNFFYGHGAHTAQRDWDPERFLDDPDYAKSPNLIRPYRVGVSCGFCHASFNPIRPPADPAEPQWENISSSVGSQYLKFGQVAAFDLTQSNFLWHLVNFGKPGTVDTSLVATDGINNPNTANGVFGVLPRIANSFHFSETVEADAAKQPVLDLSVFGLDLPVLPEGRRRNTMRVLADGADSAGGRLALARVYLNIGVFHEYWRRTANLLVGITPQTPFALQELSENSVYWNASLHRAQNMAEFLAYASGPLRLNDAPKGKAHLTTDSERLARGRDHFVTHCMVCHSTKQPGRFWDAPANWQLWVRDGAYLAEARVLAAREDFRVGNFLATDVRYPVTDIGINIARSLSDNARHGRVWHDFSSEQYKGQKPLSATLTLAHPYKEGEGHTYGFSDDTGPARVRPLPLINMWATAPYLHNNSVGRYPRGRDPGDYPAQEAADLSTAGRLAVFNQGVEELLYLRERQGYASIARTTVDSSFVLPRVVFIDFVHQQLGPHWVALLGAALAAMALAGIVFIVLGLFRLASGGIGRIFAALGVPVGLFLFISAADLYFKPRHSFGHIPAGTPVSLVANLNGPAWLADETRKELALEVAWDMFLVWRYKLPSLDHERVPDLVRNLIAINKAPDFVLDRGHDFGGLDIHAPDGQLVLPALDEMEKRDLIEYLKTL